MVLVTYEMYLDDTVPIISEVGGRHEETTYPGALLNNAGKDGGSPAAVHLRDAGTMCPRSTRQRYVPVVGPPDGEMLWGDAKEPANRGGLLPC